MKSVLLTGGSGFFGSILKQRLLDQGYRCLNIDVVPDPQLHPHLRFAMVDIRDKGTLERVFSAERFDAVFHCAAMLAHAIKDKHALWASNVDGTRHLVELACANGVPKFVYTSTNCLWARNFHRPVREEDLPEPQEVYGRSKWEAEKLLQGFIGSIDVVVLRTPTIIDSGRLGLLAILFDFILEGRKVWVVGKGSNRYQFIYGPDLADACIEAIGHRGSDVFNIGSDDVRSLREVFEYVVARAQTGAKVASLPRRSTLLAMRVAHLLKVSPLGPYHYKMIAEDFIFDTSRIKQTLGWHPTLTNEQMLWKAYEYYRDNVDEIRSRSNVSAHRQPARMGIIKVLKWLS